jgi:acyl dehydratase
LGHASIRYFALAMHDDNPLYVDEAYAQAAGHAGVIAPPTLVCETCQYAHCAPDADGYIGHEWHLPVPGCRMIRAGNDYTFNRPILATDRISVTWTLESMVEKPSSRGGTQLFVMSVATYADAQGHTVATNREALVFQPLVPHAQTQS